MRYSGPLRVSHRDLERAETLIARNINPTEDLNLLNRQFHFFLRHHRHTRPDGRFWIRLCAYPSDWLAS